jgi:hypothetical protein
VSDPIRDEESLSAELSALRSALSEVRAPDDEPALRSAARARAAAPSAATRQGVARHSILAAVRTRAARRRRPLTVAAAAAVVAAVVAAAVATSVARLDRAEHADRAASTERAAETPRATESVTAAPAAAADGRAMFRPISFPRRLSNAESYSVVRVRLELATSAPSGGAPDAAIEADLLIGEDGLARAIRFDSADTLPVYAASGPVSGERR